jgi:hypothetical protein
MNTIAFTINFTFGWWILPAILTFILLFIMVRHPQRKSGVRTNLYFDLSWFLEGGIEQVFRFLWLIPILLIWVVYFGVKFLVN